MTPLEFRIPLWKTWALFALIPLYFGGTIAFFAGVTLYGPARTSPVLPLLLFCGPLFWLAGLSFRNQWRRKNFAIRVEENGVLVRTPQKEGFFEWSQIAALETRARSENGWRGEWKTLVGEGGEILAQWNEAWFGDKFKIRDAVETAIRTKLHELGRVRETPLLFLQNWREKVERGETPARFEHSNSTRALSWLYLGLGVFMGLAMLFGRRQSDSLFLFPLGLIVVGALLPLLSHTFSIDDCKVELRWRLGPRSLEWHEIERVTLGPSKRVLVFHSSRKKRVDANTFHWETQKRDEILLFIEAKCLEKGISFEKDAPLFGF